MTTGPSASLAYRRTAGYPVPRRVDEREWSGSVPACSPSRAESDDVTPAPLLEISNAMVQLYKEAFGRGPTKARTKFAGPDTVLVLLEDAFTVTERTLLALGEIKGLQESRLLVQEALEKRARSTVESALGRQTRAFITGIDANRAVAINVFTLEPASVEDGRQDDPAFRAGAAR